jgi:hypothetical protein
MANGLENAIKSAADRIAHYVQDVAEMKVETLYVRVGADGPTDFNQARPLARTVVSLDGDSKVILPLREAEAGHFEVDAGLFDVHQRNVTTAIEYRARILSALLSALQSLRS